MYMGCAKNVVRYCGGLGLDVQSLIWPCPILVCSR